MGSHSPILFSDESDGGVDDADDSIELLIAERLKEKNLLRKMQLMLHGIPPPPSVTTTRITVEEMVQKYHDYVDSAGLLPNTKLPVFQGKETATPLVYFANNSKDSELVAVLSQKIQQRFIQSETISSCNVWFQSSLPLTGSAKKRKQTWQGFGVSPGRRLSHLARRRQVFSSANLRKLAGSQPTRSIRPSQQIKPECSLAERLNSTKRALFMSPDDKAQLILESRVRTVVVPRKLVFSSSEKKPPMMREEKPRRRILEQEKKTVEARKRPRRGDPEDSARKRKCPRRSLDFGEGEETRSLSRCSESSNRSDSLDKPTPGQQRQPQLSDVHKNKLLWAMSVALKEKRITHKNPMFKKCASDVFLLCKKNMSKILNLAVEGGTSEKMLHFARQLLPDILQKHGWEEPRETLTADTVQKHGWEEPRETLVTETMQKHGWEEPRETLVTETMQKHGWEEPRETLAAINTNKKPLTTGASTPSRAGGKENVVIGHASLATPHRPTFPRNCRTSVGKKKSLPVSKWASVECLTEGPDYFFPKHHSRKVPSFTAEPDVSTSSFQSSKYPTFPYLDPGSSDSTAVSDQNSSLPPPGFSLSPSFCLEDSTTVVYDSFEDTCDESGLDQSPLDNTESRFGYKKTCDGDLGNAENALLRSDIANCLALENNQHFDDNTSYGDGRGLPIDYLATVDAKSVDWKYERSHQHSEVSGSDNVCLYGWNEAFSYTKSASPSIKNGTEDADNEDGEEDIANEGVVEDMPSVGFVKQDAYSEADVEDMPSVGFVKEDAYNEGDVEDMPSVGFVKEDAYNEGDVEDMPSVGFVKENAYNEADVEDMPSFGFVKQDSYNEDVVEDIPSVGFVKENAYNKDVVEDMPNVGFVKQDAYSEGDVEDIPSVGFVKQDSYNEDVMDDIPSVGFVKEDAYNEADVEDMPSVGFVKQDAYSEGDVEDIPSVGFVKQDSYNEDVVDDIPSVGFVKEDAYNEGDVGDMPSVGFVIQDAYSEGDVEDIPSVGSVKQDSYNENVMEDMGDVKQDDLSTKKDIDDCWIAEIITKADGKLGNKHVDNITDKHTETCDNMDSDSTNSTSSRSNKDPTQPIDQQLDGSSPVDTLDDSEYHFETSLEEGHNVKTSTPFTESKDRKIRVKKGRLVWKVVSQDSGGSLERAGGGSESKAGLVVRMRLSHEWNIINSNSGTEECRSVSEGVANECDSSTQVVKNESELSHNVKNDSDYSEDENYERDLSSHKAYLAGPPNSEDARDTLNLTPSDAVVTEMCAPPRRNVLSLDLYKERRRLSEIKKTNNSKDNEKEADVVEVVSLSQEERVNEGRHSHQEKNKQQPDKRKKTPEKKIYNIRLKNPIGSRIRTFSKGNNTIPMRCSETKKPIKDNDTKKNLSLCEGKDLVHQANSLAQALSTITNVVEKQISKAMENPTKDREAKVLQSVEKLKKINEISQKIFAQQAKITDDETDATRSSDPRSACQGARKEDKKPTQANAWRKEKKIETTECLKQGIRRGEWASQQKTEDMRSCFGTSNEGLGDSQEKSLRQPSQKHQEIEFPSYQQLDQSDLRYHLSRHSETIPEEKQRRKHPEISISTNLRDTNRNWNEMEADRPSKKIRLASRNSPPMIHSGYETGRRERTERIVTFATKEHYHMGNLMWRPGAYDAQYPTYSAPLSRNNEERSPTWPYNSLLVNRNEYAPSWGYDQQAVTSCHFSQSTNNYNYYLNNYYQ